MHPQYSTISRARPAVHWEDHSPIQMVLTLGYVTVLYVPEVPDMAAELLTVREVAERLKLNPQTVRRWIRTGLLPASRIGRRQWRIKAQDVERRGQGHVPELTASEREAVRRIRELGEEFRKRGVRVDVVELVRESRRELEERGARSGC